MTKYDLARHPTSSTVKMMARLLERITKTNDKRLNKFPKPGSPFVPFYGQSLPTISIDAYLIRILKYCPCSNETFLSLLVYFDRLTASGLRINSYNIHRLLIAGLMVSTKYFSDIFYTNTRYAKVGGIPVPELNALELAFLKANQFELHITVPELERYGDQLLDHYVREQERIHQNTKRFDASAATQCSQETGPFLTFDPNVCPTYRHSWHAGLSIPS
ncbi:cyclin-domain-containing protein [Hesseltinella vesiculosa]|uniref:Cyclin-domain-containing protein n=1 Tax=Hesseltinella vesiculosa TaxID=101127 RepID=A0A1X2G9H4_9FUNG|nr:cyclin-domain-containing protein [Hesseltinella vesiculosa]